MTRFIIMRVHMRRLCDAQEATVDFFGNYVDVAVAYGSYLTPRNVAKIMLKTPTIAPWLLHSTDLVAWNVIDDNIFVTVGHQPASAVNIQTQINRVNINNHNPNLILLNLFACIVKTFYDSFIDSKLMKIVIMMVSWMWFWGHFEKVFVLSFTFF